MRLKLEINIGGPVLSCGDVADKLRCIANQLIGRYGEGGPLGSNIDRAIEVDGVTVGRYAVVDGAAWQPDQGRAYRYETACQTLRSALADLETIEGARVGMSGASWQDHAGTAAVSLRELAGMLDSARQGRVIEGPVVFPGVEEELENSRELNHT